MMKMKKVSLRSLIIAFINLMVIVGVSTADNVFLNDSEFTGKIGMGTSSPGAKLHIAQSGNTRTDGWYTQVSGSSYGLVGYVNTGGYGIIGSNGTFNVDIIAMDLNVGNVGIGTTSPSTKLHVVGGTRITGLVSCDTIDTDASGNLVCGTDAGAAGSVWTESGANAYRSSGNVGIGTVSPGSRLQVVGADDSADVVAFQAAGATTTGLVVKNGGYVGIGTMSPGGLLHVKGPSGGVYTGFLLDASVGGGATVFDVGYDGGAGHVSLMLMNDSGNVGIGTTSPAKSLHIAGAGGYLRLEDTAAAGGAYDVLSGNSGGSRIFAIYDVTGAAYRFWINSTGNVGIGETAPLADVHIRDSVQNSDTSDTYATWLGLIVERVYTTASSAGIAITGSTKATGGSGRVYLGNSDDFDNWLIDGGNDVFKIFNGATERLRIDSSGKVGIGTTTPSHKLQVVGTIRADNFVTTSSTEFKENITYYGSAAYTSMLNTLTSIDVASYTYKDRTDLDIDGNPYINFHDEKTYMGFIKEELPPEVVDGKGVKIYDLLSYAIGAMKALASANADLEVRVDQLEAKLAAAGL